MNIDVQATELIDKGSWADSTAVADDYVYLADAAGNLKRGEISSNARTLYSSFGIDTCMLQKFLANTIVVIAAGSLALPAFAMPPQAKSEQTRKSCETARADARGRIEKGRDITVTTDREDYSHLYSNPPKGRPFFVKIGLKGKAADSVMESPVFQKAIASEIINSCGTVGAVRFGIYQTDWLSTFGLMPSGTIKQFECVSVRSGSIKLLWGQEMCP
jgi:hypothetical protein